MEEVFIYRGKKYKVGTFRKGKFMGEKYVRPIIKKRKGR